MKNNKIKKLESRGWKVGTADAFLNLSKEESEFIRIKLTLAQFLKLKRVRRHYSQMDLAREIHSSQSRVAKMESGDPSVSLDLLIHSLLALGSTRKELAKVIS